jgi:transketolase
MHNLPVRLLASGGGLVYANLGPTHTAVEDIALISNVPNFRIFTPADALEMQSILINTLTLPNPIYIRFGKGGEKIVTDVTTEINYNVPKIFSKINAQLIILTYGVLLQNCLEAQETLFNSGINITVIHFPEITYPSMNDFLNKNLTKSKILIVEEHYPEGGLYTIISRYYFENKTSIVRIYQSCLPKIFLVKHGSQSENWKYFGLDSYSIAEKVQSIIYEL